LLKADWPRSTYGPREHNSMATIQTLVPPLSRLAKKCIDRRLFTYAESFCNILAAAESGRWNELPRDEQLHWLQKLESLVHVRGLGESFDLDDPDYQQVYELVSGLIKGRS
jgi:hypothetical protein